MDNINQSNLFNQGMIALQLFFVCVDIIIVSNDKTSSNEYDLISVTVSAI